MSDQAAQPSPQTTEPQRPYDRMRLKAALVENRTSRSSGKGQEYWNSVMDIIQKHLNIYPRV